MRGPERPPGGTPVGGPPLSQEERRRVRRSALLRPLSLIVLATGIGYSLLTSAWWFVPLTLATYAALVLLATRDPFFQSKTLGRRVPGPPGGWDKNLPPERRAARLPRGETRQKVEAALKDRRRAESAIEESDETTRALLRDALPKLHEIAERLVRVAEMREEKAATTGAPEPTGRSTPSRTKDRDTGEEPPTEPYAGPRAADEGIASALDTLSSLRRRVVRISSESDDAARKAAAALHSDLDETNLRLDTLLNAETPAPEPPNR